MAIIAILLLLIVGLFVPVSVSEETTSAEVAVVEVNADGTPEGGWAAYPQCMLEPRTDAEMDAIRATPAADIAPVNATITAETTPIDDETRAEIEAVILMADSCAESGDFDRLAALYSPYAIQNGILDGEPVQIQPGTPEATPAAAQPTKYGPPVVRTGWWVDGTHVVVELERGNSIRQLRMVTIDGAWLIDSVETVVEEMVDDGMGTPDSSAVLPVEVMQAIADLLVADDSDGTTASFTILSAEAVEWPDTFLGCPIDGAFAAQVITPGYLVWVEYQGKEFEVHTDLTGLAVTC
jgi:hypothetical protein